MKPFEVFPLFDLNIVEGKGCYVYDDKGNEYLDLYGGHAVISIGHTHPYYVKKITDQLNKLGFYSNSVINKLQAELAQKLGELSGYPNYDLFLVNSGAEANENAIKLASFHTGRKKVLAFSKAFHGRTSATVMVTDTAKYQAPVNESPNFVFVAFNDLDAVKKELAGNEYAAVIIEGIQGVGGVQIPDDTFMKNLRSLCNETGTVLIVDEVQSGYGRTGKFFAHQYADIKPDLITVAKGIGNGFPMAGVLISPIFKAVYGQLGTTFGGNHLGCVAAIAVLDVMKNEKLIENAEKIGNYLLVKLKELQTKYPQIKEVRGRGLMIGIEIDKPIKEMRTKLLFHEKVFTGSSSTNIFRLLPPLCITQDQADLFLTKLEKVL